jgi:hypothetical protein
MTELGLTTGVSAVKFASIKFLALGFLTIALPGSANETATKAQVTINVYNDAQLSSQILAQAEEEATRIFRKAGIESIWIDCRSLNTDTHPDPECQNPAGPSHLALRIVPWSSESGDAIFGVAFTSAADDGTYADVFYSSAEKLHQECHAGVPKVLGHVMAHEIGHLLLGMNAHSRMGIMRRDWHGPELQRIGMGRLLFSSEQARSMQTKLLSVTARR